MMDVDFLKVFLNIMLALFCGLRTQHTTFVADPFSVFSGRRGPGLQP
jgi:hypothetical protein